MNTRHCNSCETTKPLTDFHKDRADLYGGYQYKCKECMKRSQKGYNKRMAYEALKAEGFKICFGCHTKQPIANFFKDKALKDGMSRRCKDCKKNYRKANEVNLKEKGKAWRFARKYGISLEERQAAIEAQNGLCKICNRFGGDTLVVDHCHISGKFRGMLCSTCNSGIGMLQDDIQLVKNALRYLEEAQNIL